MAVTGSLSGASIDSPDMRRAGRELLSLGLIDARNHTLHLLSLYEQALRSPELELPAPLPPDLPPPRWLAGHIGWFAEAWIARNTQRALGAACPARPMRLASIDPGADAAWDPQMCPPPERAGPGVPGMAETRAYLLETLESTLELLGHADETDAGLYFYRLALFHEDWRGEQLVRMAQALGLPIGAELPPPGATRPPLVIPAMRWTLGAAEAPGFHLAQETGALALEVPEFEIDAQPVTWQQFCEFVGDGGYDRPELWTPEGWAWVQAGARRAPRHVEQIGLGHGAGAG
ncbi:MAG: DinB family protein, partial [Xenophilus sp.]